MKKIIAYEMVSIDGFIGNDHDGVEWAVQDPEVMKYAQSGGTKVDTFLFGRITYDQLAAFWPTPAGEKANKYYADSLNNTPKVVISKKLNDPEWQNTTVEHSLDNGTVDKLKGGSGDGSVMIFGSGTIVSQLLNLDALDEYQLLVNPIVLGSGKRLFTGVEDTTKLKLTDTKTFPSGIVLMKYARE